MTGTWHCIGFLEEERKHPYAETWGRVSKKRQKYKLDIKIPTPMAICNKQAYVLASLI